MLLSPVNNREEIAVEVLTNTNNGTKDGLKALTRNELVSLAKRAASDERKANAALIRVLCEVTRRNLFLEMGYDSLFTFLKEELGYTGGTAARRVNTVYAALELPEINQKIERGDISLSKAARLNRFFRAEKLKGNGELKKEEKREILKAVENQSERESEGILAEKATTPKETVKCEEKALSRKKHLLQFEVDAEFYQELEEAKLILSHAVPTMKTSEVFQYLIRDLLKRKGAMGALHKKASANTRTKDPKVARNKSIQTKTFTFSSTSNRAGPRSSGNQQLPVNGTLFPELMEKKKSQTPISLDSGSNSNPNSTLNSNPGPNKRTRYIKAKDKHALLATKKDGCTFKDPQTGRRCCSRYRLQADHKIPFSKGGPTELENLQWLCARHNIAKGDKAE